jgi:hypothetical protein
MTIIILNANRIVVLIFLAAIDDVSASHSPATLFG